MNWEYFLQQDYCYICVGISILILIFCYRGFYKITGQDNDQTQEDLKNIKTTDNDTLNYLLKDSYDLYIDKRNISCIELIRQHENAINNILDEINSKYKKYMKCTRCNNDGNLYLTKDYLIICEKCINEEKTDYLKITQPYNHIFVQ